MDVNARQLDHRTELGFKKRSKMRCLILEATQRVFSGPCDHRPVIQDVVREAGISRGTFYEHFDALDDAFVAVGRQLIMQLADEMLPIYDVLKEPWQRCAVGCRIFLTYAAQDLAWSRFVTRLDAWPRDSLIFSIIADDLRSGAAAGQFDFDDLEATTSYLIGATTGVMQALHQTPQDPAACIDAAIEMLLRSVGCDCARCTKAVLFSRHHLAHWQPAHPKLSAEPMLRVSTAYRLLATQ